MTSIPPYEVDINNPSPDRLTAAEAIADRSDGEDGPWLVHVDRVHMDGWSDLVSAWKTQADAEAEALRLGLALRCRVAVSRRETTAIDFFLLGAEAFAIGLPCVPVFDPAMTARLDSEVGSNVAPLREWVAGWTAANLAEPA